jgi:phosphatidylglycerophosphatase A
MEPHQSSPDHVSAGAPLWGQPASVWLATGLGVGFLRPAPGTLGAVWGVPLWLAIGQLPSLAWQVAAIALLVAVGVPICTRAARALAASNPTADAKDPPSIVWDELATVPIVYACAPLACDCATWLVAGFALHRLMDITKLWPCRQLERLPEGLGIMADDVMAALYAGGAYYLAWRTMG